MKIKKITFVGMGALGVMYGDFLAKKLGKDRVEFVADAKRLNTFQTKGMFCNGSPCDFQVVSEEETGSPADLLIFAVKATGLKEALLTVRNKVSENTLILSLLNGISSEERIGEVYGKENIIHCVVQGMDVIKAENQVTYTQFGQFCIGIDEEHKKDKLAAVLELFQKVEIPYLLEEDILRRIWSKFMLNVGVNQAVMIHEGTYGSIQVPGAARDLMQGAMKEVILLAKQEQIQITQKDFDDYMKLIASMNPLGMPSMRQDGLARRKSEVDLFSGTVISLAKKHQIEVPINQKIYETIQKIEQSY